MLVGGLLSKLEILYGAGSEDEDKAQFDLDRGIQQYSIRIGNKMYSIEWAGPLAAALTAGATAFERAQDRYQNSDEFLKSLATDYSSWDAFGSSIWGDIGSFFQELSNVGEPTLDMTMLQGVNEAFGVTYGSNLYTDLLMKAGFGYLGQITSPAVVRGITRLIDGKRRDYYSGGDSAIERYAGKEFNKIGGTWNPFAYEEYIGPFGEREDAGSPLERLSDEVILGYSSEINNDPKYVEVDRLYDETKRSDVLPPKFSGKVTYDKQIYRLNAVERGTFKDTANTLRGDILDDLIVSPEYKNLSNDDKADVFGLAYSYADEVAKQEYLAQKGVEYKMEKKYANVEKAPEYGLSEAEYFILYDMINGVDYDSAYDYAKANAQRNVIYGLPMADWQKDGLFELFDVSPEYKKETLKKGD